MEDAQPFNLDSFDVAFSLRGYDLEIAEAIQAELPDGVRAFIYSQWQDDLGGENKGDVFPAIFWSVPLCVILYRDDWGTTTDTRLEMEHIRERRVEEGANFLLVVRFGDVVELPAWIPKAKIWRDYRQSGPAGIAANIAKKLKKLERGKDLWRTRVTRHGAEHRPLPTSFYHRHKESIVTEQTTVFEHVDCDRCPIAVRFRPMVRATLVNTELGVNTQERMCPSCARKCGLNVVIPQGMDRETLYTDENPTVPEHIVRLLATRVLKILSNDAELNERGISKVRADARQRGSIALTPSGPVKPDDLAFIPWTRVPYVELEGAGAFGEAELTAYLKEKLLDFLDERGW